MNITHLINSLPNYKCLKTDNGVSYIYELYRILKTNILTYLTILIFGVSCKQTDRKIDKNKTNQNQIVLDSIYRAEKFDSTITYKPLILNYKGKSIFTIGQKTTEIDSTLSYRMDPNMDYQGYENIITDYLSTDDNLSIQLGNYSSLNGIAFFSADRKSKRIFNVSANWYFDLQKENMKQVAIDSITKHLFPILKDKLQLKNDWTYELESENQIEKFKVIQRENDKGWNLNYEVKLK